MLAGGYDIAVCSYEFYERNGSAMDSYYDRIEEKNNDQESKQPQPKRPTSCLSSLMWKTLDMPWKICVLDEAQKVNKRDGIRHQAIRNRLHVQAYVILSGTLPHNKWHDFSGYIAFCQQNPWSTHNKFLHTFASFGHSHQIAYPEEDRKRLLQKFLQGITIIRPASILNLPECQRSYSRFNLLKHEIPLVDELTQMYERALQAANKDPLAHTTDGADSNQAFGIAVAAQMAALHPMLGELSSRNIQERKKRARDDAWSWGDEDDEYSPEMSEIQARDEWLKLVRAREDIVKESGRLSHILDLYAFFRTKYPEEKMIIFSSSLRFLDIVAEAFIRRQCPIKALRYDGTVPAPKRTTVRKEFEDCNPEIPLLCTIGAGEFSSA